MLSVHMIKLFYKSSFFILAFVLSLELAAQKQDRIWLFPDSAGIDFNDINNPVAINCNLVPPDAVSASMADDSGNLLFYTGGVSLNLRPMRIFDRFGSVMQGGDTLIGYPWVSQGNMIIPFPDDPNKYYVFIANRDGALGNSLRIEVVDMSMNSGLGSVVLRDSLLLTDHINEKLNACKHANGRDWWVVVQSTATNQLFHKFLITPEGILGPFDQLIGSGDNINKFHGQMVFSKNGDKLGLVSGNATVDIFDFDRCTGDLFNYKEVGEGIFSLQNYYHGCSFSPNGNIFYTSSIWYEYKNIYQYDLTAPDIRATKQTIYSYPDTGLLTHVSLGAHLLGPDDKIYIVKGNGFGGQNWDTYYTHHIDAIVSPNNVGVSCNYQASYFDLGVGKTIQGLPTMLNYNLGPVVGSVCDSLSNGVRELSDENMIQIYPNPFSKDVSIRSQIPFVAQLVIRDEMGKEIRKIKVNSNERFDLSDLPAGVYFFEIRTEKSVFQKRFVKLS